MPCNKENKIIIKEPRSYQKVKSSFKVSGAVPLKLLKGRYGFNHQLLWDLLDVFGKEISGGSVNIKKPSNEKLNQILPFNFIFTFSQFNIPFIQKSQGRMTLRLSIIDDPQETNNRIETYMPIIVSQFEPIGGADQKIINLHKTTEQRIKKYRNDLSKYIRELDQIYKKREGVFKLNKENELENYHKLNDIYLTNKILWIIKEEDDEEIDRLNDKYKEVLEWAGPLLRGIVGIFNGFEIRVYSNDHDKHFHIIHKEKGINARFSFPGMELIDYKNSNNVINTKTLRKIKEFLSIPKNFKKLEQEFLKRSKK